MGEGCTIPHGLNWASYYAQQEEGPLCELKAERKILERVMPKFLSLQLFNYGIAFSSSTFTHMIIGQHCLVG